MDWIYQNMSFLHMNRQIFSVIFYFVNSFAFYKIAKIRGIQYPWLAFIPVFNLYMVGVVGDSLKYTNYEINKHFERIPLALALPLGYLLFNMFTYRSLFSVLGSIVLYLVQLMVMYLVFDYYDSKNKILFTVLSVIPIMPSVLILYVTRKIKI